MKKLIILMILFTLDLFAAQARVMQLSKVVRVAKELHRVMPVTAKQGYVQSKVIKKAKVIVGMTKCPNCGDEKAADEMMQLDCGDVFCKECLADQVKNALTARSSAALHCMQCNAEFTEQEIRALAEFDEAINVDTVLNLLVTERLARMSGYRHCPTPDCPYQFVYEPVAGVKPNEMTCPTCNQKYCPACLEKHDKDVTCEQAKRAAAVELDDLYNIVACPKCAKNVERGENCSHLLCGGQHGPYAAHNPTQGCGYNFCFGCLQPWTEDHCKSCEIRDEAKLTRLFENIKSHRQTIADMNRTGARRGYEKYKEELRTWEDEYNKLFAAWKKRKKAQSKT